MDTQKIDAFGKGITRARQTHLLGETRKNNRLDSGYFYSFPDCFLPNSPYVAVGKENIQNG